MYKLLITLTVSLMAVITGCANQDNIQAQIEEQRQERHEEQSERADEIIDNTPDWFITPPKDAGGLYGVGTSYSQDMQFSANKAKIQASYDIASTYQALVSGNQQSYTRETGGMSGTFSAQDKLIIDNFVSEADMTGLAVVKKVILREDRGFRSYILSYYPMGENNLIKIAKAQETREGSVVTNAEREHEFLMRRVEKFKRGNKEMNNEDNSMSQSQELSLNSNNEAKSLTPASQTKEAEASNQ